MQLIIRKLDKLHQLRFTKNDYKKASNRKYQNIIRRKIMEIKYITELLRISKQIYYQKYFEEIKKNSKRIWQVIDEIISSQNSKKTQ